MAYGCSRACWADGYIGRHPVRPGYTFVIWTGRHVTEPSELSPEETAGFWSEVARVAEAVEAQYQPAKMNWLHLGNGVPHLHVHLVPRPHDDARAGHPLETEAFNVDSTPAVEPSELARAGRGAAGTPPTLMKLELLAEGRTAEVFAYGEGRVLKLDRPDWNGLSEFEGTVLADLADAGLPVARPHGTVTVEGRSGLILDRVVGPSLLEVLLASGPEQVERLAERFAALQLQINEMAIAGLPDLVPRLRREGGGQRARRRAPCRAARLAGRAR